MAQDDDDPQSADLWRGETVPESEFAGDVGASAPEPGETLAGRYTIFDRIGSGGMGTVYRVEDLELHELIALKLLDRDAAKDESAVEQFRREVKLARRVAHRNVVRTYDYGTAEGRPFLTMEYIEGKDLREMLRESGIAREDAIAIGAAIADGMAEAHRVGIIHRDLKPENVLVDSGGRIAVSDFGIAGALRGGERETLRESGAGTPAYMAPEQVRGRDDMDHRVDVYGFGAVMFELLTGEPPWTGRDAIATAVARLEEEPPSIADRAPGLPAELVRLVDSCLARDREERPDSFGDIERHLSSLDDPGPADVQRAGATPQAPEVVGATMPLPDEAGDESPVRQRVAVAPWRVEEGADEALATGIREALVYRLGFFEELELPLREVGEGGLGERAPESLARGVGAGSVLYGRVTGEDGAVRGTARLVAVDSGEVLWSAEEMFRKEHARQVAARWAKSVGETLDASEQTTSVEQLDAQTHTLLMEGRHLMRERWYVEVDSALERLRAARERSPDHPLALSHTAVARARKAYLDEDESDAHVEAAVDLAREAIDEAGDAWAEPRYALAMAHFNGGNLSQAVATLRAALVRDPEFAEAHELMGRILVETGPLDHGIDHLERALDLNPFLYRGFWDLMRGYGLAGNWIGVEELAETSVDSDHQRRAGAVTALRMRLWRDHPALREFVEESRDELTDEGFELLLDIVEHDSFADDWHQDVDEMLAQLPEGARQKLIVLQVAAEVAMYGDMSEKALAYLERAVDGGLKDVVWLEHCPLFESIREREQFQTCIDRVRRRLEGVPTTRY